VKAGRASVKARPRYHFLEERSKYTAGRRVFARSEGLFDSELSLAAMRQDELLGAYLAARGDEAGRSRFRQDVSMIFIRR
jgi:hypothetical protein